MKMLEHSTFGRLLLLLSMGVLETGCGDSQPRNIGMFNQFYSDTAILSNDNISLLSDGVLL